jgi:hypothetical protein
VVLAACVLASSGRSFAQTEEEQARTAYDLGWTALSAGDFKAALKHYQRSYRLVPRARTMFNIATCEENLGRYQDAYRHYMEFIRLATDRDDELLPAAKDRARLLASRLKPTPRATARDRRESSRKLETRVPVAEPSEDSPRELLQGRLAVGANVDGAVVSIGSTVVGTTSRTLYRDLAPGKYHVTVERSGYAPWRGTVAVRRAHETRVRVDLRSTDGMSTGTLVLAGTGAASVAAGAILGSMALADARSGDVEDRADRRAARADLLYAVGAATLAGAAALHYTKRPQSTATTARSPRLQTDDRQASR